MCEVCYVDMQGACSSTLNDAAVTVNVIAWCSDCQQNDIVLAPALLEVLAVTDRPLVQYRQVMSCAPETPDSPQLCNSCLLLCLQKQQVLFAMMSEFFCKALWHS